MPNDLPPLREVIDAHGLRAKKSLGQNFLLDLNLTGRIARAAGPLAGHTIYEVGPGPGGLTRALLANGAERVIAVERDPRCLPALAQISAHYEGRLEVIEADALTVQEAEQLPANRPVRIVANLPYNVGTQLLVKWLTTDDWPPFWSSLTLMFQKEVAQRIVAQPGSKAYGRLSVLANWRSKTRLVFDVSPRAFTPPPKVTSAIVHIEPTAPILAGTALCPLEQLTAAAFNQRRKMLRASLKGILPDTQNMLEAADIDPEARADALSIMDYCRLAKVYATQHRIRD